MKVYCGKHEVRSFHVLLDNIATYLSNKCNAQIVQESELKVCYRGVEYPIFDCELLIYYPELDKYVGITFADYHSPLMTFFIERNKKGDILLCSQLATTNIYNLLLSKNFVFNFTYKSSIYTPSYPYISLDEFYLKRSLKSSFIDKFVFRGNTEEGYFRTAVHLLKDCEWFDGYEYIDKSVENYFNHIVNYKVGLSIPGVGELCYRDVEYMALGIPFIKMKYISELNPPLIPNFHYIAIERFESESDYNCDGGVIACERKGNKRYANAYKEKFLEVRDNKDFLLFISDNARKYYENYLHPLTRLYHLLSLLEINNV
jgi:hypothetical protein